MSEPKRYVEIPCITCEGTGKRHWFSNDGRLTAEVACPLTKLIPAAEYCAEHGHLAVWYDGQAEATGPHCERCGVQL